MSRPFDWDPAVRLLSPEDRLVYKPGPSYRLHHAFTPEEYWHETGERCAECEKEDAGAGGQHYKVEMVDRENGVITIGSVVQARQESRTGGGG